MKVTDEMKELILEEIENEMERLQKEDEHNHWLFIVGLARELFPGDNKAVERVEDAMKIVLRNIHGEAAMDEA